MLSNTTIATLMASLDINIVIIALPTIQKQLPGTSLLDLLWVLLGYQLVVGSVLVNFGRLADIYGRVRLYKLGFIIFTVGSALCSISQNGTELILFRMVQGVGGAFLISNTGAIIVDTFPLQERGKALGINRVSQIAGATGGLVLGGFLTTVAGWQSIFWVNVPIGIGGILWTHYKLKELGQIKKNQKIDVLGNITFAAGLSTLLAGVSLYALGSLSFNYFVLLMGGAVGAIALFVFIETRVEDPMLDLSLFKIRPFSGGTIATFLNSLARGCLLLVMTSYLQGPTMSLDPLLAGVFLLPNSISISIVGPISGWLSDRGGTRFYTTLGLVVSFFGFLILTGIGPKSSFLELALPLTLVGAGQGLFSSPNRASVMNAVPPSHRGVGSAVNSTMIQTGNSFSRAFSFLVMGLVLPAADLQNIFSEKFDVSPGSAFVNDFISSLHLVFLVCAVFVILSIIPSILRGPSLGSEEGEIVGEEEAGAAV